MISYCWQCFLLLSSLQLMSEFILFWHLKYRDILNIIFQGSSHLSNLDSQAISVSSGRIILCWGWSAYTAWLREYHTVSLESLAWRYWRDWKSSHSCWLCQLRFFQELQLVFCLWRRLLSCRAIFRGILLKITYKMLFFKKFIHNPVWWNEWLGIHDLATLVYFIWEACFLRYLWIVI